MRKPRGILFDLGGTVLGEFQFDRLAARIHLLGIAHNPKGITMAEYAAVAQEFHTTVWDKRDEQLLEFPVAAFWRLVDERLGITFDMPMDDVELEFWRRAVTMRPQPGIGEALEALRADGLPLGVVSNSAFSGRVLSWELEQHGLLEPFEFVMSSADYGVRKPHRAMFMTAAAKLGLAPRDAWFIGDLPAQDVAGALAAEMTALWYNPNGLANGEVAPHAEVRHWSELPGMVAMSAQ